MTWDEVARPKPSIQPSIYQQAVYDWIEHGEGDAVVNAVAGSGKTTTLIQAASLIRGSVLFAAFNKHIAETIAKRIVRGADCKTMHSIGYAAISNWIHPTRLQLNNYKYEDIIGTNFTKDQKKTYLELLQMIRLNLIDPDDEPAINELIAHYGIDHVTDEMVIGAGYVLGEGRDQAKIGKIDFTDMLWIPYIEQLQPKQYDFVLVDEAQDLSAAQLNLVMKTRNQGGRMIFVGDPYQSIYGFAGADNNSFTNIRDTLQAKELPLSICYRCPSKVLNEARRIVAHIEDRPEAPEGIVASIKDKELIPMIERDDLILCRVTAPLISQALALIRANKPATVRGRDIGKNLITIIQKVAKMSPNPGEFSTEKMMDWTKLEEKRIMRRARCESALQTLQDKVDSIMVLWEEYGGTVGSLTNHIEQLFSDSDGCIALSTIHRAKGLENRRVFIIRPDKLQLEWNGQLDWEAGQEINLKYVAVTRATEALYFVQKGE